MYSKSTVARSDCRQVFRGGSERGAPSIISQDTMIHDVNSTHFRSFLSSERGQRAERGESAEQNTGKEPKLIGFLSGDLIPEAEVGNKRYRWERVIQLERITPDLPGASSPGRMYSLPRPLGKRIDGVDRMALGHSDTPNSMIVELKIRNFPFLVVTTLRPMGDKEDFTIDHNATYLECGCGRCSK